MTTEQLEKSRRTREANKEKRRQRDLERQTEREKIRLALLSVLDDAEAASADKVKAIEMLRDY